MNTLVTPESVARVPSITSVFGDELPKYNWETQTLDYQIDGDFKAAKVGGTQTHCTRTGIPLFEDPDYDSDDDDD
jgi:hypothetical protein